MRLGVWSCVLWYLSRDMSVWYQCFFNCDWHSKLLISGSLPGIVGMGLAHLPLRWNDAPSRISHVTWCGDPAWKGFGHAWGLGVSGTINVVMLPKTLWPKTHVSPVIYPVSPWHSWQLLAISSFGSMHLGWSTLSFLKMEALANVGWPSGGPQGQGPHTDLFLCVLDCLPRFLLFSWHIFSIFARSNW